MLLAELVPLYERARNAERPIGKELSPNTIRHLRESESAFSKWLARAATVAEFDHESINRFLAELLKQGCRPHGVKNRRSGLLVLLRFARRSGLSTGDPALVRRIFCPELQIDGYDVDAMQDLLAHAKRMGGTVRHTGLKRSVYWESFLRVKWELGLRIGDMIRIKVEHFKDGWLWIHEKKTGKAGWRQLTPETAIALELCIGLKSGRQFIWEGYAPQGAYKAFKRLATRAKRPGTSRFVRRGAASEFEAQHPGQAWIFLKHSTPTLFPKHYRVGRICDKNPLRPPPIG